LGISFLYLVPSTGFCVCLNFCLEKLRNSAYLMLLTMTKQIVDSKYEHKSNTQKITKFILKICHIHVNLIDLLVIILNIILYNCSLLLRSIRDFRDLKNDIHRRL
jgi:hypothetical protein